MPTELARSLFNFARVEGRDVIAHFDSGAMTSNAGTLLLGATDEVLTLTQRIAARFKDSRNPIDVGHAMETLMMQRVSAIALGSVPDLGLRRTDYAAGLAAQRRDLTALGCEKIWSEQASSVAHGDKLVSAPAIEPL